MAEQEPKLDGKVRETARVDFLVDENGSRIELPDDSAIRVAGEHETSLGGTGPTNWWLYGMIALAIIIALLLVLQMISGAPGTDMQPGSPTSAPVTQTTTQ
ncbi:hypothetical protein [Devosia faecipullorum]|uniref:hypothetical protein n=1 Tax=Devosia faecipullorum TaxID=2755039 RepID=UPI00187B504B|nr:hypothetical protein [Devosia faecipullorum]MBE7734575.1 hypothetical protein [Devosia faecipullorum]